jgi:hypothetical protein
MTDNERREPPATYSPRASQNPNVQALWGEALAKVGQQTNDARFLERMLQLPQDEPQVQAAVEEARWIQYRHSDQRPRFNGSDGRDACPADYREELPRRSAGSN